MNESKTTDEKRNAIRRLLSTALPLRPSPQILDREGSEGAAGRLIPASFILQRPKKKSPYPESIPDFPKTSPSEHRGPLPSHQLPALYPAQLGLGKLRGLGALV